MSKEEAAEVISVGGQEVRITHPSKAYFTKETKLDLTDQIPRGSGKTYLRTVILAVDHASYHIGQIVAVRRLLGAWPAK